MLTTLFKKEKTNEGLFNSFISRDRVKAVSRGYRVKELSKDRDPVVRMSAFNYLRNEAYLGDHYENDNQAILNLMSMDSSENIRLIAASQYYSGDADHLNALMTDRSKDVKRMAIKSRERLIAV